MLLRVGDRILDLLEVDRSGLFVEGAEVDCYGRGFPVVLDLDREHDTDCMAAKGQSDD